MNLSSQDVRPLDSRHPFQVFLLVVCLLNGGPLSAGIATSRSIAEDVKPHWILHAWGVILIIGGVCGLAGMFWPDRRATSRMTGLLIERTGLVAAGMGALVFSVVLFATIGMPESLLAGGVTAAFGAASLVQAWRITRAIWRLRHRLQVLVKEEERDDRR